MSEWQPIETVPKEGTEVLLYVPVYFEDEPGKMRKAFSHTVVVLYEGEGWLVPTGDNSGTWLETDSEPTHWMALPNPPKV